MEHVNLKRYQVTTVDDALAVLEDNGEQTQLDLSGGRGTASLERGLSLTTKAGQAIQLSQKGKKDTVFFTLQVNLADSFTKPDIVIIMLFRVCRWFSAGFTAQTDWPLSTPS